MLALAPACLSVLGGLSRGPLPPPCQAHSGQEPWLCGTQGMSGVSGCFFPPCQAAFGVRGHLPRVRAFPAGRTWRPSPASSVQVCKAEQLGGGGALQGTWGQGRSPGLGWGQQLTGVEGHCVWTLGSPSSPGHSDCGLARLGQRALWRVSQAPRCGSEQGIREAASSRRDVWGSWEARRLSVAVRSRHAVVASWAGP